MTEKRIVDEPLEPTWRVVVQIPLRLTEHYEGLFDAIANAANDWQPEDRTDWDVFVSGHRSPDIEASADPATIERVAKALAARDTNDRLPEAFDEECREDEREHYRGMARAAVRALQGEA